MSEGPIEPASWQASDSRWYPPELHPDVMRPRPTAPPSGNPAVVWTLLAAFWLWFLLPVAVHYTRKARREIEASGGRYQWSRGLLHRPILLWLVVYTSTLALILMMGALGAYGP
jgi:hypothetical protein